MRPSATVLCLAGLSAGCAAVLGIPDDTPSFCARPENQGHAYCEDFDVGDYTSRWTFQEATTGASYGIEHSDSSSPNLLALTAPAVTQGSYGLAGFTKEFDGTSFVGLHIEADMRFVTQNEAGLSGVSGGFMIIVDKNGGGCVGLGLGAGPSGPALLGAFLFAHGAGCSALTAGTGGGTVGSGQQAPLGTAPPPNEWSHIVVIVTPDPSRNDGSGRLTFNIVGQPSAFQPVPLLPGTLDPSGIPLVGFAAEVNGPSGPLEVQYDNVTIDLKPN